MEAFASANGRARSREGGKEKFTWMGRMNRMGAKKERPQISTGQHRSGTGLFQWERELLMRGHQAANWKGAFNMDEQDGGPDCKMDGTPING